MHLNFGYIARRVIRDEGGFTMGVVMIVALRTFDAGRASR